MGFVGDKPMAQHKRSFCAAFFKKRLLSFTASVWKPSEKSVIMIGGSVVKKIYRMHVCLNSHDPRARAIRHRHVMTDIPGSKHT
ncbi:hypothetical protein [Acidocella sp.]|jgi:hypothetical protein|uniref:hypothetical protein n=1 Tax=Acidocella sp. TaxID=50710 RepID=UPI002F3ED8ED